VKNKLSMNHCLNYAVSFGASGKNDIFFVLGLMEMKDDPKNGCTRTLTYHIFKIHPNEMQEAWNQFAHPRSWLSFLTPDGKIIWRMLQELFDKEEMAPHFTRIQFLKRSGHGAYKITFPKSCEGVGREKAFRGIDKNEATRAIAVKVFEEGDQAFRVEEMVLKACNPPFFLGCWSTTPSSSPPPLPLASPFYFPSFEKFEEIIQRETAEILVKTRGEKGKARVNDSQPEGAAILMKVGERVQGVNGKNLFNQARESLERIHKKGWCHCDLRPSNILLFPGLGVEIIDFDHACECEDEQTFLAARSGRSPYYPLPLFKKLEGGSSAKHVWTKADDIEMLARSCLDMQ
jgi:Protein kinase domain